MDGGRKFDVGEANMGSGRGSTRLRLARGSNSRGAVEQASKVLNSEIKWSQSNLSGEKEWLVADEV